MGTSSQTVSGEQNATGMSDEEKWAIGLVDDRGTVVNE